MSKIKFLLYSSNKRKDGSYPVCLRVAKGNKVKYINLGLSAMLHQWNVESQRFKKDKRINPEHEKQNSLLNVYDERVSNILREFAECRIDWTLNQFEEKFVGQARKVIQPQSKKIRRLHQNKLQLLPCCHLLSCYFQNT